MLVATLLAFLALRCTGSASTSLDAAPPSTPAPKATAKPNPFTIRGYLRAYDFTRQNASGFPSTANQLNQQSVNFAGSLHLDYRIAGSGFSVGVSYLYANPLNGCNDPRSTAFKCATLTGPAALMNPNHLNPDTTLPAYGLSTFYETYLQYEKGGLFARVGDQVIDTPWAYASDSRLKPNAFQGVDISYRLTPHLTFEVMDIDRYQSRITSDFTQQTLLTGALTELPHTPNPVANTGGFQYGHVGYSNGNLTSNLYYYHYDDLAYLGWVDGKYTFAHQQLAPYIAVQAGDEKNVGSSIVGKINSQVYGAQLGVNVTKHLLFTVGVDAIPRHIENLPAASVCSVSTGQIAPSQTYPNPSAGYFVGMNAPQCFANPNGTYSVEYGGIASPYTYAGDPLFTTSLTQGMAIRRAPGSSEKLALTYTSTDKRLVVTVSRAYYDYGFDNFPDQTAETDADATYRLNKVPNGAYRGLLLRFRYGVRTDDHSSALNVPPAIAANGVYFGGLPYFVYNRTQLEYDF